MEQAIAEKVFPSAVCAVLMGGRVRFQGAWGKPNPEADTSASATTLYDLASLTKPIATTTLALIALEEGLLSLETLITRFFPQAQHFKGVTVRHLLTHTSGLPAWRPYYRQAKGHDAVIQAVLETPLIRQPGAGYTYSDAGYILMGAILEKVYERTQSDLFHEKIAVPLGLQHTTYNPPVEWRDQIAPTGHSESREGEMLIGQVHDENAHAMDGFAGHAGLFGTLDDLIRFVRMVLAGGRPLLSYYSVQAFLTPNAVGTGQPQHTLGLFAHPNTLLPRGDLFPTRCVGHSGFTGTVMLFDPQVEMGLILLTNHVYYGREKEEYLEYRRRILNVLAGQIGEV